MMVTVVAFGVPTLTSERSVPAIEILNSSLPSRVASFNAVTFTQSFSVLGIAPAGIVMLIILREKSSLSEEDIQHFKLAP